MHGDVTTTDWWDGVAFDGALCNMALMDIDEAGTAPPSWSPEHGYSWEGRWSTQGTGVRGHADVNHRTLATYLNAMVEHGLILEEFAEPDSSNVPRYLAVRCRSGG